MRVLAFLLALATFSGCDIERREFYVRTGMSEGKLVAGIGMPISEMRKRSTFEIEKTATSDVGDVTATIVAVFDFELAGTGLRIPRCGGYWIDSTKSGVIEAIQIYPSVTKLTRGEVEAANRQIEQRLFADGWSKGHLSGDSIEPLGNDSRTFWRRNDLFIILHTKERDGRWLQDLNVHAWESDEIYKGHVEFPQRGSVVRPAGFEPAAFSSGG